MLTMICRGLSTGLMSLTTCSTNHGFTTMATMSASPTAALLLVVMLAPISAKRSSFEACGLATVMSADLNRLPFNRPSAKAPPMAPAPMIAIFIPLYYSSLKAVSSRLMKSSALSRERVSGGSRRSMSVPALPVKQYCS